MMPIEEMKAVCGGTNEVHRQPPGEQYAEHAVHGPGESVTSMAVPGFMVDVASLLAA